MRTFELKRGTDTLTLDDTGGVKNGATNLGKWITNAKNQILVTEAGGATAALDVVWKFDGDNHLLIQQDGKTVFDVNGDKGTKPGLRLDLAILLVKPDDTGSFEFALRPSWDLSANHDLIMTNNG